MPCVAYELQYEVIITDSNIKTTEKFLQWITGEMTLAIKPDWDLESFDYNNKHEIKY